jgi:hypothetical protein
MLVVRCKSCNTEIIGSPKIQVCGCPNKMEVRDDKVSAVDLTQVVMINGGKTSKKEQKLLSDQDLAFQEARKARKVRKLDFEIR